MISIIASDESAIAIIAKTIFRYVTKAMQVAALGAYGLILGRSGASIWEANPWGRLGGAGKEDTAQKDSRHS